MLGGGPEGATPIVSVPYVATGRGSCLHAHMPRSPSTDGGFLSVGIDLAQTLGGSDCIWNRNEGSSSGLGITEAFREVIFSSNVESCALLGRESADEFTFC